MTKRNHVRSLYQLAEDCLFPSEGPNPDPEKDRRHLAISEVLCRLPEDDYQKLTDMIDDFLWFIPPDSLRAKVHPFTCTTEEEGLKPYAKVLYLSPSLERSAFDIVVVLVAHELAHIVLKHKVCPVKEGPAQEDAAWELVRQWGFEKEYKKNEAGWKRRDAREKKMLEQLKRLQNS